MISSKNIKSTWDKLSVKLCLIAITLLSILATFPEHFLAAWAIYSPNFLSVVPVHILPYISIGLLILKILAELITAEMRKELKEKKEELEQQLDILQDQVTDIQAQPPIQVNVKIEAKEVDNGSN